MREKLIVLCCLYWIQVAPVSGATELEIITEQKVDGQKTAYIARGLHQGEYLLYTVHASDEDPDGTENLFISRDGGKTIHHIDSKDNTCRQWSQEEFTKNISQYFLKTTDKFNVTASGLNIEKIFEEPGGPLNGIETQHSRYKITFIARYKYGLLKGQYEIERLVDIWLAPTMESVASSPVFQKKWQYTGDSELDRQMRSLAGAGNDFRLRSEIQQSRTDKKGKKKGMEVTQYLRELKEVEDLPLERFEVPDCRELSSEQMEKKLNSLLKDMLR